VQGDAVAVIAHVRVHEASLNITSGIIPPTAAARIRVHQAQLVITAGAVTVPNPARVRVHKASLKIGNGGPPAPRTGLWTYRGGQPVAVPIYAKVK
jgi:hypothetical protein